MGAAKSAMAVRLRSTSTDSALPSTIKANAATMSDRNANRWTKPFRLVSLGHDASAACSLLAIRNPNRSGPHPELYHQ